MRLQKKLLSLAMIGAGLLSSSFVHPSPGLPLARTLSQGVKKGAAYSSEGFPYYTFLDQPSYTNIVEPGSMVQKGEIIEADFGSIKYGTTYYFVFKFGGLPMSVTSPLKIKAHLDTQKGYTYDASLSMPNAHPVKNVDTTGVLTYQYMKDDDAHVITVTSPTTSYCLLTLTLDIGNGGNALLTQASAYYADSYQGLLPYKGEASEEDEVYDVVNNEVTIQSTPSDPVTPGEILAGVIAYDEYDDEWYRPEPADDSLERYAEAILEGFKVSDYFIVNLKTEDRAGNVTYIKVTILFVDITPPTIAINGEVTGYLPISYDIARSEEALEAAIKQHISISDDNNATIPPAVEVKDYKPLTLGIFDYHVTATDGFNEAYKDAKVKIIDDVNPEINGSDTISTATSSILTVDGLLSYYEAVDEIDGENVHLGIQKDEYHEGDNSEREGDYDVVLVATDQSGNKAEKTITVEVRDKDAPVWFVYKSVLTVIEDASLTPMEIVDKLVVEGTIDDLDYVRAEIVSGQPVDGTQEPGEYQLTIKAETMDGQTRYANLTLKVIAASEAGIQQEKVNGFFQFFIDLWNSIVSFFKSLFNIA